MTHHIETRWMGKMQFNAEVNGHTIVMDAPERVGGEDAGPIPKPLLLTALSGCTGMDVAALLRKGNTPVETFSIRVDGEISKRVPIEYTSAHITYSFTGNPAFVQPALDAVVVSQEKLCGVSHMLKKIIPVTWEIHFNGETVYNNKPTEFSLITHE